MAAEAALRTHTIKTFGWMPDLPDMFDHMYAAPQPTILTLRQR